MKKQLLERRHFSEGQIIVREGEDAFVAFIIQSGKAQVYVERGGRKVELSVLEAGQIFGEMALLKDGVRKASVRALTECNLVVITRDVFQQKLDKTDVTIKAIVEMLSNRVLKANDDLVKSRGVNINSFIELLNQLFRDLLEAMPDEDKMAFKAEAFPAMKTIVDVLEKYRDKLE